MSKIREKESLECGRMHIWALKTKSTPTTNCSLHSCDYASLCQQLLASEPGPPPTKSWIRTCFLTAQFLTHYRRGFVWRACRHSRRQECTPVGCVPSVAVAMCIPACTGQGVSARGCVCPGGCLPEGCLPGGVYPDMHWSRHPPVDRMTDRCKNITIPQLRLQTVKISNKIIDLNQVILY